MLCRVGTLRLPLVTLAEFISVYYIHDGVLFILDYLQNVQEASGISLFVALFDVRIEERATCDAIFNRVDFPFFFLPTPFLSSHNFVCSFCFFSKDLAWVLPPRPFPLLCCGGRRFSTSLFFKQTFFERVKKL